MFFALSKLLWFLVNPGNLLMLALLASAGLSFTRRRTAAIWLLRAIALVTLFLAVVPLGAIMRQNLESRFPVGDGLPGDIAGIVILGGVINPRLSAESGIPQLNGSAERLTVGAALARRYPAAKVIFSGGSGDLFNPDVREAHYVAPVFTQLGLKADRVIYEDRARNTAENAYYAKEIANPAPGDNWILVTSAFHMPRAVGVFRKAGWDIIPYPVDFNASRNQLPDLTFNLVGGLSGFAGALHEFIGLTAYWITGRTDAWYPAPTK